MQAGETAALAEVRSHQLAASSDLVHVSVLSQRQEMLAVPPLGGAAERARRRRARAFERRQKPLVVEVFVHVASVRYPPRADRMLRP